MSNKIYIRQNASEKQQIETLLSAGFTGDLKLDMYLYSPPVPDNNIQHGTNTYVTLTPKPDSAATITKRVHYNRVDLTKVDEHLANANKQEIEIPASVAQRISLNNYFENVLRHYGIPLESVEYVQALPEVTEMVEGTRHSFTLKAKQDSYLLVGSFHLEFQVLESEAVPEPVPEEPEDTRTKFSLPEELTYQEYQSEETPHDRLLQQVRGIIVPRDL